MASSNHQTLAGVDRVEKGFVIVMVQVHGSGNGEDNFREMAIPAGRFKTLPRPGAVLPVDTAKKDVITLNIGSRLCCEVEFSLFGAAGKSETRQYEAPCKLSGLYDNPADDTALRKLRSQFWKQCNDDKEKLEQANPDKSVFIAKTSWWTDKYADHQTFSEYIRQLGTQAGAGPVPGNF